MERVMERTMEQAQFPQAADFAEMEHMERMERGSRAYTCVCFLGVLRACAFLVRVCICPFHMFHMFYLRENRELGDKSPFHSLFHARSILVFQGVAA
ncbi:MAG: hypothetical protein LAT50_01070 [Ectothiorhodospiraceae bacterium]|nr:hypothetical protein [Ectothiorhodospiraceae bacterium]